MNTPDSKEENKNMMMDWLPHALIFGGLALSWLGFEGAGLVMYGGFFLYGLLGLVDSVKKKYYSRGFSLALLKLLTQALILLAALSYITLGYNSFMVLLMLIILDTLFLTSERISPRLDKKPDNES